VPLGTPAGTGQGGHHLGLFDAPDRLGGIHRNHPAENPLLLPGTVATSWRGRVMAEPAITRPRHIRPAGGHVRGGGVHRLTLTWSGWGKAPRRPRRDPNAGCSRSQRPAGPAAVHGAGGRRRRICASGVYSWLIRSCSTTWTPAPRSPGFTLPPLNTDRLRLHPSFALRTQLSPIAPSHPLHASAFRGLEQVG